VECELQATDIMNVTKHRVVKVKGMTTKWARKNAVESGVTTLFATNSVIDDSTDELIIPTGETIKVREPKLNNGVLLTAQRILETNDSSMVKH
jgi:hypothetical protein